MRPSRTDLMQNFRYHVVADDGSSVDPLQPVYTTDRDGFEGGGQAGFQSVTLPELSVEASEYREGLMKWTQKYPGVPTVSDVTLMRGISKRDTVFFDMVMNALEGKEYRADIIIYHYHRTEMDLANAGEVSDSIRRIECGESFATRAKPAGDLDATAGDISMAEVDLAIENFDVKYD